MRISLSYFCSFSDSNRLLPFRQPCRLLNRSLPSDWHIHGGLWYSPQSSVQLLGSHHSQHGGSCYLWGSWAAWGDADGGEEQVSDTADPLYLMLVFLSDQALCNVTFLLTLTKKPPPSSSLSASVGAQQEHTDTVQSLRFTLDFTYCLMEVAGARGAVVAGRQGDVTHLSLLQQQSLVADQISSLSREWR